LDVIYNMQLETVVKPEKHWERLSNVKWVLAMLRIDGGLYVSRWRTEAKCAYGDLTGTRIYEC